MEALLSDHFVQIHFCRMKDIPLASLAKSGTFEEQLHISRLTISLHNILVATSKAQRLTESAENAWQQMMKYKPRYEFKILMCMYYNCKMLVEKNGAKK